MAAKCAKLAFLHCDNTWGVTTTSDLLGTPTSAKLFKCQPNRLHVLGVLEALGHMFSASVFSGLLEQIPERCQVAVDGGVCQHSRL